MLQIRSMWSVCVCVCVASSGDSVDCRPARIITLSVLWRLYSLWVCLWVKVNHVIHLIPDLYILRETLVEGLLLTQNKYGFPCVSQSCHFQVLIHYLGVDFRETECGGHALLNATHTHTHHTHMHARAPTHTHAHKYLHTSTRTHTSTDNRMEWDWILGNNLCLFESKDKHTNSLFIFNMLPRLFIFGDGKSVSAPRMEPCQACFPIGCVTPGVHFLGVS